MATLLVRNFDDGLYEKLKADAKANHRSIAAEVKARFAAPPPAFDKKAWSRRMRTLGRSVKPDPEGKSAVALIRELRDER